MSGMTEQDRKALETLGDLCAGQWENVAEPALQHLAARLRGDGEQWQAVATFVGVMDGQRLVQWHTDDVATGAKLYDRPQPVAGDAVRAALEKVRDRFFPVDQPEPNRDQLWREVDAALSTQPAPSAPRTPPTGPRFTNAGDSEAQFIADSDHLNCPACGGSGHVEDALSAPSEQVAATAAQGESP